jgi:transcriptional regulator GlxA family with amidase domain
VRFVRDGRLVTAGGVMSGIEMALWLVERLYGVDVLRQTRSYIAYDHPPRERAEVSQGRLSGRRSRSRGPGIWASSL